MRVFIGVPIRDVKEYGIKRWLDSVVALDWDDYLLYMVDNSDDESFVFRVADYCKQIGLTNYEIVHLENQRGLEPEARLVVSRENYRLRFLQDSAPWFMSWECDVILPPDTLKKLVKFTDEFDWINHTYPDRGNDLHQIGGMGCTLIRREILERFSFLENGGTGYCNPIDPSCSYSGDSWLVWRVYNAKYSTVTFDRYLKDVDHLSESNARQLTDHAVLRLIDHG